MAALDENLLTERSKPKLVRSFTQVEHDALSKCLEVVEGEAIHKKEKGLSTLSFFLGVTNCLFVAWSFGAIPEHFWLVYIFEAMVLFPLRFRHQATAKPLKQNYYWLDFCWVANFMGMLFLATLFLDHKGFIHIGEPTRKAMFSASWGIGCGILLLAAGFLGNALIFHDADNVASVLIHLFPSLVLYTLRWCHEKVHKEWPAFKLDYFLQIKPTEILLWSMAMYCVWFVFYTLWLMCCGMGLPKRSYDTIFHANMRGGMGKLIYTKGRGLGHEHHKTAAGSNEFTRVDALIYQLCHLLLSSLAILTSLLCFYFWQWHAMVGIAMTLRVIYNGAARYNYYLIDLYSRKLKDLMNST